MWKLWHRLFGWDYVAHRYGYDNEVSRLRVAPNGTYYVKTCGNLVFIEQLRELRHLTWRDAVAPPAK